MSAPLLARLAEQADDPAPFLTFLERSWSRRDIWREAEVAAGGLAGLELAAGRPIGILLPNLPGALVALLAICLAGRRVALVDGRQAMVDLHDWAAEAQPAAIVTLDLASVFERARALAAMHPPCRLIVMPIADHLGFWKRIIAPWLRGGGAAKRPEDTEILAWRDLLSVAGPPVSPHDPPMISEIAPWPDRANGLLSCPLSEARAVSALFSAWCASGRLVLSPRLDEHSLAKVRKASCPDLEIAAKAS